MAVTAADALQARSPVRWSIRWGASSGLPRTLSGGRSQSYGNAPIQAAAAFLHENKSLFALQSYPLTPIRRQLVPDGTKVTFEQTVDGLPVVDATIGVIVTDRGEVAHVSSGVRSVGDGPRGFALTAADVAGRARADRTDSPTAEVRIGRPVRTAVFPSEPPRPAYEVYLSVDTGYQVPWRVIVDGQTGEILDRRCLVSEATRVFDPNPVSRLNWDWLTDQNDSDSAVPAHSYVAVTLQNLDPPVDGIYSLSGKFAQMVHIEIPTNIPPTSASGDFDFFRAADGFEEVMVYYTIDRNQTYIQSLGFTSVCNFPLRADAHGFMNADNSRYVGLPLGQGYLDLGDGGVDDAEDADIILHEYAHAIQDNCAPGLFYGRANNGYGNETGALSEGFGDYWAASAGYETSVASGFPVGYVGEWDSRGYADGPAPYLRRVDTDKVYPWHMTDDIHADGEIWSAALWDIFNTAGREATDRIVLYSHFLVPTNPDFEDAANALFDADALLYPIETSPGVPVVGAHYNQICAAMSARNILSCTEICDCLTHGDPFLDGYHDILDLSWMIDEILMGTIKGGTDPLCPHKSRSDYNCDQFLDAIDIAYALDYVFNGGISPCDPCAP